MPNRLSTEPLTRFLQSVNSSVAFDANKKTHLLNLAFEYLSKENRMPSQTSLCKAVGISLRTLERHLKADEAFKAAFREILLRAKELLTDVMFERGLEPGGYMDRITWLRHYFPEDWNPNHKIQISPNSDMHKKLAQALIVDIDPEIIDVRNIRETPNQD